VLLSVLKNSLSKVQGVLIILSWRLSSDTKGAVRQAIEELTQRMVDTEGDKDIGAVAFFSSQTGLGPFKTDDEIKAYFRARLIENSIQFSEDSSLRLGEITNRVPRSITTLAHYVYDTARKENVTIVTLNLVEKCFCDKYPDQIQQATDLCADLSLDSKTMIKALYQYPTSATAPEIAKDSFPDTSPTITTPYVQTQLDKLCQSHSILQKNEDKYSIVDSFHKYALKIALGIT
jgi:hypothetical protein